MLAGISHRHASRLCAAALVVSLSGCASTGATKTVSTLAGSSAGAIAANAISVAGPWGYAVSLVSSALGGFAGDRVSRLFGGGNEQQLTALVKVLQSSQTTALEPWGAQDGKAAGGYAEATGPVFTSNAGARCRSFMLVAYKKAGALGGLDPMALKQGVGAVSDVKASAEKLGDVNSVADAVSGAENAAGAVKKAQETVSALTPATATSAAPAIATAAAPAASGPAPLTLASSPTRPAGAESFGTACKDAKDVWQVIKPKA